MLANLMSKMSVLPFCLTATGHLDYLGKDLPLIPRKKNGNTTDTHETELSSWTHILGFAGPPLYKKRGLHEFIIYILRTFQNLNQDLQQCCPPSPPSIPRDVCQNLKTL